MANLYSIKSQIKSVLSVEKITKAMRVISSVKFSSCQNKANNFSNYFQELNKLMGLSKWHWYNEQYNKFDWLFNLKHEGISSSSILMYDNPLIIILFSDIGLCGDINSNLSVFAKKFVTATSKVVVVGKKGIDRIKGNLFLSYETLQSQINGLISGHDSCFVIFNDFVSMLNHVPVCDCIFPFLGDSISHIEGKDFSIFDTSYDNFTEQTFDLYLSAKIKNIVYKQSMSEYSTRIISMNNANDNANKLISNLKLSYNRRRQTKITQEIIEIVSGMEIMENI